MFVLIHTSGEFNLRASKFQGLGLFTFHKGSERLPSIAIPKCLTTRKHHDNHAPDTGKGIYIADLQVN